MPEARVRDGPYPSNTLRNAKQACNSHHRRSDPSTCLGGGGLVVAVTDGRRSRYELADARLGHTIKDVIGVVLAVDPACCAPDRECLV